MADTVIAYSYMEGRFPANTLQSLKHFVNTITTPLKLETPSSYNHAGLTGQQLGAASAILSNLPAKGDTPELAQIRSLFSDRSKGLNNGNYYDPNARDILTGYDKARRVGLEAFKKMPGAESLLGEGVGVSAEIAAIAKTASVASRMSGAVMRAVEPLNVFAGPLHSAVDVRDRYRLAEQFAQEGKIPKEALSSYKDAILPAEAGNTLTGGMFQTGYGAAQFKEWAEKYKIQDRDIRQQLDPSGASDVPMAALKPSSRHYASLKANNAHSSSALTQQPCVPARQEMAAATPRRQTFTLG